MEGQPTEELLSADTPLHHSNLHSTVHAVEEYTRVYRQFHNHVLRNTNTTKEAIQKSLSSLHQVNSQGLQIWEILN